MLWSGVKTEDRIPEFDILKVKKRFQSYVIITIKISIISSTVKSGLNSINVVL